MDSFSIDTHQRVKVLMVLEGHCSLRAFFNEDLVKTLTNDCPWTTSVKESWSFPVNAESVRILEGSPWAAKWAGDAGVPSVRQYDVTTLTWPVVFGAVDVFKLTGVTYFCGSGGKAGDGAGAETTAAAKNLTLITQTG
uniref:Uncharacterized protein n=1 Tax=Romanomermis culicivorax TaxID=13658 RepID=A0A915I1E3_ROMCU